MNQITLCPNCETNFDSEGFCVECGLHAEELEKPDKRNPAMKNITVSISKKLFLKIEKLIKEGILVSVSETARRSLAEFFQNNLEFHRWMDADNSKVSTHYKKKKTKRGMSYL